VKSRKVFFLRVSTSGHTILIIDLDFLIDWFLAGPKLLFLPLPPPVSSPSMAALLSISLLARRWILSYRLVFCNEYPLSSVSPVPALFHRSHRFPSSEQLYPLPTFFIKSPTPGSPETPFPTGIRPSFLRSPA